MLIYQENKRARPAGTGIIPANAIPDKRGIWDLYETTNPSISMFDRCFWIETDSIYPDEEGLKELAVFIRDNVFENIVVLEFGHRLTMGGYGSGKAAGNNFLTGRKDKDYMLNGFEIRLHVDDAITFKMLWRGHDGKDKS